MADERRERDDGATGVGPGITGASGEFIEGTGGDRGIGGTGEFGEREASGRRPDERHAPPPQELGNAKPESGTDETRIPGGASGSIGGGGGLADVPGGTRNVGPPNDQDSSGARVHLGSRREEPQEEEERE